MPPCDTAITRHRAIDRDQQLLTLHRQALSCYAIVAHVGCSEPTIRRALKRLTAEEGKP